MEGFLKAVGDAGQRSGRLLTAKVSNDNFNRNNL